MFLQLGNIVFQSKMSPSSWSVGGDEAQLAQLDLINSRPRQQLTGQTLQEQTLSLLLRADWCNPKTSIAQLKAYKDDGEILPLLLGTGEYIGDFVIVSMPYSIDQTFQDGRIVQATVTLSLREFIAYSKAEIQAQQARKKGFAVGDKKTIVPAVEPVTNIYKTPQLKVQTSISQTASLAIKLKSYQQKAQKRAQLAKDIISKANQAKRSLDDAENSIRQTEKLVSKGTGILSAIQNSKTMLVSIANGFPPSNLNDVETMIDSATIANTALKTASENFFIPIIIRRETNGNS